VPQKYSANAAWGIDAEDREAYRKRREGLRLDGVFTPPSVKGILATSTA
jgi:hypothetical protein